MFGVVLVTLGYTRPAMPFADCAPQSDGSCVTVQQFGDERYNYTLTIDGYLVVKDAQGDYVYADSSAGASGIMARNADKRSDADKTFLKKLNQRNILDRHQASSVDRYPELQGLLANFNHATNGKRKALLRPKPMTYTKGELHFPVFLVSTSDRDFGDAAWYERSLNEVGFSEDGHYGSVHDYFVANSDSLFKPIFDVFPVKIGLESTKAGDNDGDGEGHFIKAVIDSTVAKMGDLSIYDSDGDKNIDGFGVILAGTEKGSGLWGHMYYYTAYTNPEMYEGFTGGWWGSRNHGNANNSWGNNYNGYKFDRYLLIAEMSDPMSYVKSGHNGIGVFIHEFSHILGLPDFYTMDDSYVEPLAPYEIMSQGMYNGITRSYQVGRCPAKYSAFERESMGWMTIPDLQSSVNLYSLEIIDRNKAYSVTNPKNKDDYYVIEYRPRVGWDKAVSDTVDMGILIWHVDYDKQAWEYYPNRSASEQRYVITAALNLSKNKTFSNFKYGDVGIYDAIKEGEDKVCFATKPGITVECPAPEPESSASATSSSATAPTSSAAAVAIAASSSSAKHSHSGKSSTSHRGSAAADSATFNPTEEILPKANISVTGQEIIIETAVHGLKHVRIFDALGSVVAKYDFDTTRLLIPIDRTMRHGAYFVQVHAQQKTLATARISY